MSEYCSCVMCASTHKFGVFGQFLINSIKNCIRQMLLHTKFNVGWGSALPPRSTGAAYGPDVVGRKSNNIPTKSNSTRSTSTIDNVELDFVASVTGSNNHL